MVKPLNERILIKFCKESETTKSGLITPNVHKKKNTRLAEVIEVGDSERIRVEKGDIIILDRHNGTPVDCIDECNEMQFILYDQIMAIKKVKIILDS